MLRGMRGRASEAGRSVTQQKSMAKPSGGEGAGRKASGTLSLTWYHSTFHPRPHSSHLQKHGWQVFIF